MKKFARLPWKKVDLHTHSSFSDGVLTPEALSLLAQKNEVDLWALTDHDTLEGLPFAQHFARLNNVDFIPGVEISCAFNSKSVHIVGLNIDFQNAVLQNALQNIKKSRFARAQKMSAELEKVGIPNALEGALSFCKNPNTLSRAHFARYLVQIGKAKTVSAVFERYLEPGKPGYVEHQWASVEDAVLWIKQSGGVAVLAHPGRYAFSKNALHHLLENFKEAGGEALEAGSAAHSPEEARYWADVAKRYGFWVSCGSDFHAPGEQNRDLGRVPLLLEPSKSVWHLWAI